MRRSVWLVFAVVQVIGEVSGWSAGYLWSARHFSSSLGPNLWAVGFVLLLPGNIAGGWLVQKLLWMTGLTLAQLAFITVPVELAINAAVWLLCVTLYKLVRTRRPSVGHTSGKAAQGHQ